MYTVKIIRDALSKNFLVASLFKNQRFVETLEDEKITANYCKSYDLKCVSKKINKQSKIVEYIYQ